MMQRTLCMVKPDATARGLFGEIMEELRGAGLEVLGVKYVHMTKERAKEFYAEHKDRPFYGSLVEYMTSGPVGVMALSGERAVLRVRELIGATDPAEAKEGTIRARYGESVERNSVHGSDSASSARRELSFWFAEGELGRELGAKKSIGQGGSFWGRRG